MCDYIIYSNSPYKFMYGTGTKWMLTEYQCQYTPDLVFVFYTVDAGIQVYLGFKRILFRNKRILVNRCNTPYNIALCFLESDWYTEELTL